MGNFLDGLKLAMLLVAFVSIVGVMSVGVADHNRQPDPLPDPEPLPSRASGGSPPAHWTYPAPIVVSAHKRDAGPFMETVLLRAEAAGGYALEKERSGHAFSNPHYSRLDLMAPPAFARELDELRAGQGGHVNSVYRNWVLDGPSPPGPSPGKLVPVTVDLDYQRFATAGTQRWMRNFIYSMFGAASLALLLSMLHRSPAASPAAAAVKSTPAPASSRAAPAPGAVSLAKADLEWRRSGELIIGVYRDFELELRGIPAGRPSDFRARVVVRRAGRQIYVGDGLSYDIAIDRGLAAIRDRLHAERLADRCFADLTGTPEPSPDPVAAVVTALVGRGPEVRARYMG